MLSLCFARFPDGHCQHRQRSSTISRREASLEKVKNELRDLCTLLFTYFQSSLEGDFKWVAAYQAYCAKPAE